MTSFSVYRPTNNRADGEIEQHGADHPVIGDASRRDHGATDHPDDDGRSAASRTPSGRCRSSPSAAQRRRMKGHDVEADRRHDADHRGDAARQEQQADRQQGEQDDAEWPDVTRLAAPAAPRRTGRSSRRVRPASTQSRQWSGASGESVVSPLEFHRWRDHFPARSLACQLPACRHCPIDPALPCLGMDQRKEESPMRKRRHRPRRAASRPRRRASTTSPCRRRRSPCSMR